MRLLKEYPSVAQTKGIAERISHIQAAVIEIADTTNLSATAQAYIRNGDFFSGSNNKFRIDVSWMPRVMLANSFYDKVIKEFSGTKAAELAYQRKLFTIIGWKDPGQYDDPYGVEASFSGYMPRLLLCFSEFEAAFPNSMYLQGFRYQIAQVYWKHREWEKTKEWLDKIAEKDEGKGSFYGMATVGRLFRIEY